VRALLVGFLGLWLAVAPAAAQRGASLSVELPSQNAHDPGPAVWATNMLADAHVQELMRNGFPAALHFRLELWRTGGVFDEIENTAAWDVLVQYDPYTQQYRVVRRQGKQVEDFGGFPALSGAEAVIERPYRVPLVPARPAQRYYYNAVLDVESLSVSDLDELQRWLRGDLQPAVHGRGNPFSAIRNGVGRLLSRILGGEKRHYEERSPTFTAP
jgi:hypothetical protein